MPFSGWKLFQESWLGVFYWIDIENFTLSGREAEIFIVANDEADEQPALLAADPDLLCLHPLVKAAFLLLQM